MSKIIDGKKIADKMLAILRLEIKTLKLKPKLAVIFVGSHSPSQTYIKRKQEACEKVGIDFILKKYSAKIRKNDLIKKIKQIQKTEKPHGLVIQLPLPNPSWTAEALNAVNPEIDVDCLTEFNQRQLSSAQPFLEPPTPAAIIKILTELKIKLKRKKITILGAGILVGKPLAVMLAKVGATVKLCNSKTKDIKRQCRSAGIIITAVGKYKLLTADMVKKGATVIDAGTVFINHKMYGDADFANVKKKVRWITPTPGGVGPITVAKLLGNTVRCAKKL